MNLDETIYLWRQCPVFNHYSYIDTIKIYFSVMSPFWKLQRLLTFLKSYVSGMGGSSLPEKKKYLAAQMFVLQMLDNL